MESCDSGFQQLTKQEFWPLWLVLQCPFTVQRWVGLLSASWCPLSLCRPASIVVNLERQDWQLQRYQVLTPGETGSIRGPFLEAFLFLFYFLVRASGLPWTLCTKYNFGFQILLPLPPPWKAAITACVIMFVLCGARDQTLGLLNARQTFYQLSCLCSL